MKKGNHGLVESDYREPKSHGMMMKRPEWEREKWLEGTQKEFRDFNARGMWRVVKMNDMSTGRRLIGSKWVFKLKRNGVHWSRLVTLGHTQMSDVDFTDDFSGVVHDVTLRMALTLWLVLGLDVDQIDVETAFLEEDLKADEYMCV